MVSKNMLSHIDLQIGERLKNRRIELNISLKELSSWLDVPYQQIQKYENGENRIPAGFLYLMSQKLNVGASYFYDNISLQKEEKIIEEIIINEEKILQILIVQDNYTEESSLREAIKNSGIQSLIHVEHNSANAMKFLRKQNKSPSLPFDKADIILLDLNLPEKDGKELLRDIKRDRYLKKVPVIIVTSNVSKKDMEDCYANDANSYFVRSYDDAKFYEDIKNLLAYWKSAIIP